MIVSYIDKKIQETLKARERAFARKGQSSGEAKSDDISFSDIMSRTVYIRMASNKEDSEFNVMLDGGTEVSANVRYRINEKGDVEAYTNTPSTRKGYGFKDDGTGAYRGTQSMGIRPIAGIKDISVEYKGGYKAIRKATINWSVGSIEDLDRLTPHFLTIGQTIALEWGWQKSNKKDTNVGNFITIKNVDGNNVIDVNSDLFDNPIPTLISKGGDYDAMGGIISNFEYKLREDGGFDCVTYITSLGGSLFKKSMDKEGEIGLGAVYDKDAIVLQDEEDIENMGGFKKSDFDGLLHGILNLKNIVSDSFARHSGSKEMGGTLIHSSEKDKYSIRTKYNHNLIRIAVNYTNVHYFVRWGWFEDNILTKYLSLIDDKKLTLTFRSIELDESGKYKSCYISNNKKNLVPIDPLKFILFGQNPSGGNLAFTGEIKKEEKKNIIKIFDKLATSKEFHKFSVEENDNIGQIRNIYVNITEIQKAFGIEKNISNEKYGYVDQNKVKPPSTIEAGLNSLLKSIESNFYNQWKFNIVLDTNNTKNLKIVDENYVSPGDENNGEIIYSKFDDVGKMSSNGIYKFPSFNVGSIVKGQDLSFKIPDSMAVTAMYGSSNEKSFASEEYSKYNKLMLINKKFDSTKDNEMDNLSVAYLKHNEIGNIRAEENKKITAEGGWRRGRSWLRYIKTSIKKNESDAVKMSLKDDRNWSYENGTFTLTSDNSDAVMTSDNYYIYDEDNFHIVMKPKAAQAVRDFFNSPKEGSKYLSTFFLIPAELSLEVDGIGGIQPGNICQTDYIQKKYNENVEVDGNSYGPLTFFQIFGIDQKVDGSGWTTSLSTKMRVNTHSMGKVEEFFILEYLSTLSDRSFDQSGDTSVEVDYNELDEEEKEEYKIVVGAAAGFSGETETFVIPQTGEKVEIEPLLKSDADVNAVINEESKGEVSNVQSDVERKKDVQKEKVVNTITDDEVEYITDEIFEAIDYWMGTDEKRLWAALDKIGDNRDMANAVNSKFDEKYNIDNKEDLREFLADDLSGDDEEKAFAYFGFK